MATYILVHGAWHGGWCWQKLVPLLEREGHTAIALDLPGHGRDQTPISEVSLQAYTDRVCDVIDRQAEPVILVGHSMGGAIISQAAEYRADKISALVYICAYLLRDGETLTGAVRRDAASEAPQNIIVSEDRSAMTVRESAIKDLFYTDCTGQDVAWAKSQLVPQATRLWGTPLHLTETCFGRVPRIYIECLRDQAISLPFQRQMYTDLPCREVLSLDTDHSPFLSAPEQLAELMLQIRS